MLQKHVFYDLKILEHSYRGYVVLRHQQIVHKCYCSRTTEVITPVILFMHDLSMSQTKLVSLQNPATTTYLTASHYPIRYGIFERVWGAWHKTNLGQPRKARMTETLLMQPFMTLLFTASYRLAASEQGTAFLDYRYSTRANLD